MYLYLKNTKENQSELLIRFGYPDSDVSELTNPFITGKAISFDTDNRIWRIMSTNEIPLFPRRSSVEEIDRILKVIDSLKKEIE